ncbi:ACT domain-containing protein [Romboutsia sp. 1001713B170207_170306_H8]|nr:Aspartokinase [uncultured Clostridium sp.]
MISQTAPINEIINVSFTIPKEDLDECKEIAKKYSDSKNIVIDDHITKFSLVGSGMKNTAGVISKVFKIFKENNINVKLITTSEIRITCAINSFDKDVAINEVAREFNV